MLNVKNVKIKTALAAVTLAAFTIATPFSASAADYDRKCNDTANGVLGAVIGGSAGAAIGESIAGRGDRTEGAIFGAIIGGIAGAAVGDNASDCEKDKRSSNRSHTTRTNYPTRTHQTTTVHRTVGHNTYGHSTPRYNNHGYSNVSYSHTEKRLRKINRRIDELRSERAWLKDERRRSRGYRPGIEKRLDRIGYRLAELKREKKHLKRKRDNRNDAYRPHRPHGQYHSSSQNVYYRGR